MTESKSDIYMEESRPQGTRDEDGDEIYWGECFLCGERTYDKVKNVTHRNMVPGETYYYTHPDCAEKFKMSQRERERKMAAGSNKQ